jgi:hypothetical protein
VKVEESGDAAARSDCTESRVERLMIEDGLSAMGDIGGVESGKAGGLEMSRESRLVVFTAIPAFLRARMRSAMLPPEATIGPSS